MSSQTHLTEYQLYNVLMLALSKFTEEVEKTNTTDWDAFETFINNLRAYTVSFRDVKYLYEIRTATYTFLNMCESCGALDSVKRDLYCTQVQNQVNSVLNDANATNELSFLIRTLYETDSMFTESHTMSDCDFETLAMLLDLPQKLVNYINSNSFRQDLFYAVARAHAMYTVTPSTINGTRYSHFVQILYIVGLLERGINDYWLDETADNEKEFQRHLSELLGLDLSQEIEEGYSDVFDGQNYE